MTEPERGKYEFVTDFENNFPKLTAAARWISEVINWLGQTPQQRDLQAGVTPQALIDGRDLGQAPASDRPQ